MVDTCLLSDSPLFGYVIAKVVNKISLLLPKLDGKVRCLFLSGQCIPTSAKCLLHTLDVQLFMYT